MMIKPGITELDRCVDSRYTLVSMVAKRARMIGAERHNAENSDSGELLYSDTLEKPVTQAVEEISDGVVGYVRSVAIDRAKVYEEEKFQAINQMQAEAASEASAPAAEQTETTEEASEQIADETAEEASL